MSTINYGYCGYRAIVFVVPLPTIGRKKNRDCLKGLPEEDEKFPAVSGVTV